MVEIGQAAVDGMIGTAGGVLVIAEDRSARLAQDAVAMAQARSLGLVGWSAASERLARQSTVALVLAEASGVADALVVEVLPQLEALARRGTTRIVATFDTAQIDLVAGSLAGPGIDLLCTPTLAERVAALCLARAGSEDRVLDVAREAEATRLRRLHEEVARIAETLARLSRDDSDSSGTAFDRSVGEPGTAYRSQPDDKTLPEVAARDIRQAIRARRLRDQYFGAGLFEDPAWDMLLDLFAAELERAQVSVSSLCIAAAVAPTTALRWIARMTDAGLFERQPDPFDRRRAFMGLSRRASVGMRTYVAAVWRTGATLA
jgi:hypothetical protein